MTDTAPPERNATVEALRALSGAFDQLAIAVSIIAREGAIAAEVAEQAGNAAGQAVSIAKEVRDISRSIDRKLEGQQRAFEDFFGKVLVQFSDFGDRIVALEKRTDIDPDQESNGNGHG